MLSWLTVKISAWCIAFGEEVGSWYCGILQILLGLGQLGQPVGILGPPAFKWYRMIVAWLLVLFGVINILRLSLLPSDSRP